MTAGTPAAHLVFVHAGTAYHSFAHESQTFGSRTEVHADGVPARTVNGWYVTGSPDTRFETVTTSPDRTVRWDLRDPLTASVRYPATVTDLSEVADPDDEADLHTAGRLYQRVTEPGDTTRTLIDLPVVRLDGEPAPDDGLLWQAALPHAITDRPEFVHLFPGVLTGYRTAVKGLLESLPTVKYAHNVRQQGSFDVTIDVPFDPLPAVTRPAPIPGGRKSRTQVVSVASLYSRRLTIDVPDRIEGATRADAVLAWHADLAVIREEVQAASFVACGTCKGTGRTETPFLGRAKQTPAR